MIGYYCVLSACFCGVNGDTLRLSVYPAKMKKTNIGKPSGIAHSIVCLLEASLSFYYAYYITLEIRKQVGSGTGIAFGKNYIEFTQQSKVPF